MYYLSPVLKALHEQRQGHCSVVTSEKAKTKQEWKQCTGTWCTYRVLKLSFSL